MSLQKEVLFKRKILHDKAQAPKNLVDHKHASLLEQLILIINQTM
jgi:hypothetical protein